MYIFIVIAIVIFIIYYYFYSENFIFTKPFLSKCDENETSIKVFDYSSNYKNPSSIKYFSQLLGINETSLPTNTMNICLNNSNVGKELIAQSLNCNIPIPENVDKTQYCSQFNNLTNKNFLPDDFNKVCTFTTTCENVINSLTTDDKINDVYITDKIIQNLQNKKDKNSCVSIKNQWNQKVKKYFKNDYDKYFDPETGYLNINGRIGELITNISILDTDKLNELNYITTTLQKLLDDPLIKKYEQSYKSQIEILLSKPEIKPKSNSSNTNIFLIIIFIFVLLFILYNKKTYILNLFLKNNGK